MKKDSKNIRLLILHGSKQEIQRFQNEVTGIDMTVDVETAGNQKEFIKKVIRFKPNVVIAGQLTNGYKGTEAYMDLRNALPFAFFILIVSSYTEEDLQSYGLTGIDAFLPEGNYSLVRLMVLQGFNKKHLEETFYETNKLMLQKKERLLAVFNNNQNAVFIINFKNEVVDVNPAGIDFLKAKSAEELLGARIIGYFTKQDLQKIRSAGAAALRGKINTIECNFELGRGIRKHASVNFIPMKNIEGFIETVMMICKDLTDAYMLSERFKLTEGRFLQLADKAPIAIFYNDVKGNCLFVNRKWSEYTGLTVQQSLGKGWLKCLYQGDKEKLEKVMLERVNDKAGFTAMYRVKDKKGNLTWLRSRISPFMDENGRHNGYIATAADFSESKPVDFTITVAETEG